MIHDRWADEGDLATWYFFCDQKFLGKVSPKGFLNAMSDHQESGRLLETVLQSILISKESAFYLEVATKEDLASTLYSWYDDVEVRPPKRTFQFPFLCSETLQTIGASGLDHLEDSIFAMDALGQGKLIHGVACIDSTKISCPVVHFAFRLDWLDALETKKELYLSFLAVNPSARCKGLASYALSVVEVCARLLLCHTIRLHTPSKREGSIYLGDFYQNRGFGTKRTIFRYYDKKYHAMEMVKKL